MESCSTVQPFRPVEDGVCSCYACTLKEYFASWGEAVIASSVSEEEYDNYISAARVNLLILLLQGDAQSIVIGQA